MKLTCRHCNKDIKDTKGFSSHLRIHNITYIEYVRANLDQFPNYKLCPSCNENWTFGNYCSHKCLGIANGKRQSGQIGWSRGLTKDTHSGLNSVSKKATVRNKGRNIWSEMSEETKAAAKKKISKKTSERVKGSGNPMFGRKHNAETVQKIVKRRFKSTPEKFIITFLTEERINFYFQYFISSTSVHSYDFKIKGKQLIIEVDGDYWHGGPGVKVSHKDVEITKATDKLKQDVAEGLGFKVVRIWESEIKINPQLVKDRLRFEINNIKK